MRHWFRVYIKIREYLEINISSCVQPKNKALDTLFIGYFLSSKYLQNNIVFCIKMYNSILPIKYRMIYVYA